MDDDIDDLLNDVEQKYCRSNQEVKSKKPVVKPDSKSTRKPQNTELDDMINDIFEDDDKDTDSTRKTMMTRANSKSNETPSSLNRKGSTGPSGRKCYPVFIGDSQCARGLSSAVNNRACDNLRCTDCDFSICMFPNYVWHSSVDYLFLRNNIPDLERLKPKLVKQKGACAYACQCKWRSVKKTINLQQESDLKWVCGKH